MQFENVYIPLGAYWTTPFAKWQGTFSTLHPLKFAAECGAPVINTDLLVMRSRLPDDATRSRRCRARR